jgi:hypothetical protein
MPLVASILYPVAFSPFCIAMTAYVKREANLLGASISLVHLVGPTGYNGLQLYGSVSAFSSEHIGALIPTIAGD